LLWLGCAPLFPHCPQLSVEEFVHFSLAKAAGSHRVLDRLEDVRERLLATSELLLDLLAHEGCDIFARSLGFRLQALQHGRWEFNGNRHRSLVGNTPSL
jgi:hypothetical protein